MPGLLGIVSPIVRRTPGSGMCFRICRCT